MARLLAVDVPHEDYSRILSLFVLVANPTIGSKQSGLKNSSGFVFEFSR